MVVDVSRSEYERICLDMAGAATKELDLAFIWYGTAHSGTVSIEISMDGVDPFKTRVLPSRPRFYVRLKYNDALREGALERKDAERYVDMQESGRTVAYIHE